jgi:hypothetical protein
MGCCQSSSSDKESFEPAAPAGRAAPAQPAATQKKPANPLAFSNKPSAAIGDENIPPARRVKFGIVMPEY